MSTSLDPCDVRLLAIWEDDPTQSPMTIDLRLDRATHRMIGSWSVFGALDMDGKECLPFILRADGRIECAQAHTQSNQQAQAWRTNLRQARIDVGESFIMHWNDQDQALYRIQKIAILGSKDS
ncbi:MAG: hypothetical protein EBY21_13230 [Alphaproteobacteria bacterium]|nr:hypothetical protein [Alphaproteobacteria bacterium]